MTARGVGVAEVLAHHTGGGAAFTREVNQRIGARVTVVGVRRHWRPAALTLAAVTTSVATSVLVVLLGRGWAAAVVAAIGWQLAYGLDCSDGQLARVTGRTSAAGAALDLYGDWLSRVALVCALVLVAGDDPAVPAVAVVAVAAGQLAGLYHQAVRSTGAVPDLPRSGLHAMLGLASDPGLLFLVYAVSLALDPAATWAALGYGALLGAGRFAVRFGRITARAARA